MLTNCPTAQHNPNPHISRVVHEIFWGETETRPETDVSETEARRCSFRDADRDLEAPETLESLGSFNVSPRRLRSRMVKHIDNEKNIQRITFCLTLE